MWAASSVAAERGFARTSLSSGRRLLPWIVVLFVSLTLASAMSNAMRPGVSASDQQSNVQAALPIGEAAAEPCSGLGSGPPQSALPSLSVAESHRMACNPAVAPVRTDLRSYVFYDPSIELPRVQRWMLYVGLNT
jgi:hypothetical protein